MKDRDAAIQRMIADACLGADAPRAIESDLRAFLSRHDLDPRDAASIAGAAAARLPLYRRLVRNNLVGVTSKMLPLTRARLNATASGAFDASFAEFLATVGPRTHYLRDVPAEFLAWTAPRWATNPAVPPYASDMAAHELVELQVGAVPVPPQRAEAGELALDRPLVFSEAQRLMRYRFAVHEHPSELDDPIPPEERPVCVFVYRNAEHDVGWMELSPLHARILESLVAGAPLAKGVSEACQHLGVALTQDVLAAAAALLAELAQEGVLLGALSDAG